MSSATSILLPVILAGALTGGGAATREAERTALFRVDEAWAQAAAAKDLEKTVSYGVGTNEMTVNDAQGRPMTQRGRGITVWRKDGKAGWKCVVDIWNPEPPAPPAK